MLSLANGSTISQVPLAVSDCRTCFAAPTGSPMSCRQSKKGHQTKIEPVEPSPQRRLISRVCSSKRDHDLDSDKRRDGSPSITLLSDVETAPPLLPTVSALPTIRTRCHGVRIQDLMPSTRITQRNMGWTRFFELAIRTSSLPPAMPFRKRKNLKWHTPAHVVASRLASHRDLRQRQGIRGP